MARPARNESLDPLTVQIAHAYTRCVRRAFLCGEDPVTGRSFDHRREWINQRLEFLASVFAIDCLTFSILGNHLHLILRNRPDLVRTWSDEEVARRWLTACPPWKNGRATEATEQDVQEVVNDPGLVGEYRVRLSNISWWMRLTKQKIARQSNIEDGVSGHFWEARFDAKLLLDEASILACAMYVDLNPIRAALAESLEDSEYTGAKARIDDLKASKLDLNLPESLPRSQTHKRPSAGVKRPLKQTRRWERSQGREHCGWLSPIEISETASESGPDPSRCGRRASLKGFLGLSLLRYLELLDWTGRQLRPDKRGAIPASVPPILTRLGITSGHWLKVVDEFGQLFKRAVGTSGSLQKEANRRGQSWMQGPGAKLLG